jgi:hypothetical protein
MSESLSAADRAAIEREIGNEQPRRRIAVIRMGWKRAGEQEQVHGFSTTTRAVSRPRRGEAWRCQWGGGHRAERVRQ